MSSGAMGERASGGRLSVVSRRRGLALALLAVLCIACASVFVRWSAPLSSLEITFWRLVVAAGAVAAVGTARGEAPRIGRRDVPVLAGAGLVTAIHFLAYIAALGLTTVAHALSLVYTAPLFVAALAAWRLGERLGRRELVGALIVVLGVAVLAGFEPQMSSAMLMGDGLAIVSAISFGVYSVVGRALRHRYSLLTYTAWLYGSAAVWLLPPALLQLDPGRYTPLNLVMLLALGLIPLGVGHTCYNAALRHLPAATVNVIATQEVTGGIILAWLLLGEAPSGLVLVGVGLTLAGVLLVLLRPASGDR